MKKAVSATLNEDSSIHSQTILDVNCVEIWQKTPKIKKTLITPLCILPINQIIRRNQLKIAELPIAEPVKEVLQGLGIVELFPPKKIPYGQERSTDKTSCSPAQPPQAKRWSRSSAASSTCLERDGKVIYLAPLRALASEKFEDFKSTVQSKSQTAEKSHRHKHRRLRQQRPLARKIRHHNNHQRKSRLAAAAPSQMDGQHLAGDRRRSAPSKRSGTRTNPRSRSGKAHAGLTRTSKSSR